MRIDKPIASLVRKLNKIDGVYPRSSCGGHKNPKGSRSPIWGFFVIMNISNTDFLEKFYNFLSDSYEDYDDYQIVFKYSKLYGTWLLHGEHSMKELLYEPWIENYIKTCGNLKPQSEWNMFKQIEGHTIQILEK